MSKPAAPHLVRALVDFYEGGRLLYKKDNIYPLSERLELLKGRGEAEDCEPQKPATTAKQPKAVKQPKGADEQSAAVAGSPPGETDSAGPAEQPPGTGDAPTV